MYKPLACLLRRLVSLFRAKHHAPKVTAGVSTSRISYLKVLTRRKPPIPRITSTTTGEYPAYSRIATGAHARIQSQRLIRKLLRHFSNLLYQPLPSLLNSKPTSHPPSTQSPTNPQPAQVTPTPSEVRETSGPCRPRLRATFWNASRQSSGPLASPGLEDRWVDRRRLQVGPELV